MEIIPLGTNGFFSSFNRETACYAIPYGKILILLDAGTGLFRLAEKEGQTLLKKAKEIHIFLSHLHLDHTFGFYCAFKLFKGKRVQVFSFQGRKVFVELNSLNYFPIDYQKEHRNFCWSKIEEGMKIISGYQVSVIKQNHRQEVSLAFRLKFNSTCEKEKRKELAYVTDSEPTESLVDFVKEVPLLLIEHSERGKKILPKEGSDLEKNIQDGHITTYGAALIAKRARIGRLILIHHKPFLTNKQIISHSDYARSIFPRLKPIFDLDRINF